jgi:hypothetical protein
MGRPKKFYHRKTVEKCLIVDISWLRKKGFFKGPNKWLVEWTTGLIEFKKSITIINKLNEFITFVYVLTNNYTKEKEEIIYDVELIKTPCNFGGFRYWFKCPGVKEGVPCGRLSIKLYLSPGGNYFLCRHCYDLTYRDRQKKGGYCFEVGRLRKKIEKIDEKLKKRLRWGKRCQLWSEQIRLIKLLRNTAISLNQGEMFNSWLMRREYIS